MPVSFEKTMLELESTFSPVVPNIQGKGLNHDYSGPETVKMTISFEWSGHIKFVLSKNKCSPYNCL